MSGYQLPPLKDPCLFEAMICDMFNENAKNQTFKQFGKSGHRQKGIDIFSNDAKIVIQCKLKDLSRSKAQLKREFLNDIDDTIDQLVTYKPDVSFETVFIVTTLSEDPDFDEYCEVVRKEKGLEQTVICWGWETIQQKLGITNSTIKAYYPNYTHVSIVNEELVKYTIKMKQGIERNFALWLNFGTGERPRRSRMILHSIDDKNYPEHVYNSFDQPRWFGAEIDQLFHNGLGFVTGIDDVFWIENVGWTIVPPSPESKRIKVARIEIISFEDIVTYDLNGDDHYNCPHFFCKFSNAGRPFAETFYRNLEKGFSGLPLFFDETNRAL